MRSVRMAIWASIDPVLVSLPPKSAKLVDFFSFVNGIFDFFNNSSDLYPIIVAAKVGFKGLTTKLLFLVIRDSDFLKLN